MVGHLWGRAGTVPCLRSPPGSGNRRIHLLALGDPSRTSPEKRVKPNPRAGGASPSATQYFAFLSLQNCGCLGLGLHKARARRRALGDPCERAETKAPGSPSEKRSAAGAGQPATGSVFPREPAEGLTAARSLTLPDSPTPRCQTFGSCI